MGESIYAECGIKRELGGFYILALAMGTGYRIPSLPLGLSLAWLICNLLEFGPTRFTNECLFFHGD